MSSNTTQLKVFEGMLKDLKGQVLSEMQSLSPDDEKIANLAIQIDNLDARIRKMAFNDEEKEDANNDDDEGKQESKTNLTQDDLAKVRWTYIPGEKDAIGCITLNPNKKQIFKSKNSSGTVLQEASCNTHTK